MIRVMIVEDQKLVRSLLESYIQNEDGYQLAVSIPGAAEASILCDTEDIDLVLMDVQTEHRENGLAAAKKIREAHPTIKIVVATSLIDTQVLGTKFKKRHSPSFAVTSAVISPAPTFTSAARSFRSLLNPFTISVETEVASFVPPRNL